MIGSKFCHAAPMLTCRGGPGMSRRSAPCTRADLSSTRCAAISSALHHRFSVAPMREYTDRHLRRLLRLLSTEAVLWSEMEKAGAILERSGRGQEAQLERLLRRGTDGAGLEVLQLGGDDPQQLARATSAALPFGYDEVRHLPGCFPFLPQRIGRLTPALMSSDAY